MSTSPDLMAILPAARCAEYLTAAGHDRTRANALYLWDVRIAQAFHLPLHFAELALRNAVDGALRGHIQRDWHQDARFVAHLSAHDPQRNTDLVTARRRLREVSKPIDVDRIVATLTFGFWSGMLAPRFGPIIWHAQLRSAFPGLPAAKRQSDVFTSARQVGKFRNRIYHHRPLLGHNLSQQHSDMIELIDWVSPDLARLARRESQVPQLLRQRP